MADRQEDHADRMIRDAFTATARPALSLYFNSRVRAAVAEEKRRKRAAAIRVRIMRTYWVLAALTSVLITLTLPWSESSHGAWLSLLYKRQVLALPMMLVRVNLLDLIFDSVRKSSIIT